MHDLHDLLVVIKQAAIETVESSKPANLVFGKIDSTSPLSVNVENKLKLSKEMIIVPQSLTEYGIEIDGEKKKINNTLKDGDEVILLRVQGGQKYLILDRVVK